MATTTTEIDTAPKPQNQGSPSKTNLVGLTRAQLTEALRDIGVPERALRMRQNQIWHWIYHRGVTDFMDMTNVSKDLRQQLANTFAIERLDIVDRQISKDGTRKWLFGLGPGTEVETVYIPEDTRGTLCVSSQVGCTLNCRFCHTGTQRLVRNLTPAEIVSQVMIARDELDDWPEIGVGHDGDRAITNIVMMGMGEPLYNFDNVRDALGIVSDGDGIAISKPHHFVHSWRGAGNRTRGP